jgi:hypothetical protein
MMWVLAWYVVTQACSRIEGALLIMECASAGLVSEEYRSAMTVAVDVRAGPVGATPSYWAGLALNGDVEADNDYVQAAITRGIEPFDAMDEPRGVILATTGDSRVLGEAPSAEWHRLSISYDGRQAYICVNEECGVAAWGASAYRLELLCVADNPGQPNAGGLTRCEWKDMRFLTYLPGIAQP